MTRYRSNKFRESDCSSRVIPMSAPLRDLLQRLQKEHQAAGSLYPIVNHKTARKCLETACRKLGFPAFYHSRNAPFLRDVRH